MVATRRCTIDTPRARSTTESRTSPNEVAPTTSAIQLVVLVALIATRTSATMQALEAKRTRAEVDHVLSPYVAMMPNVATGPSRFGLENKPIHEPSPNRADRCVSDSPSETNTSR